MNQSFYDICDKVEITPFQLELKDKSLEGINPRDENLDEETKTKIIQECINNYWYFIREIVMIPTCNSSIPYGLDRASLALNYCLENNINVILESPICTHKSTNVCVRILYEILKSKSINIDIVSKYNIDACVNLDRTNIILNLLPEYISNHIISILDNISTYSTIERKNISKLNGDIIWFDDFSLLPNNESFLEKAMRINKERKDGNIVITMTPGDMQTKAGVYAYCLKEDALKIDEYYLYTTKKEYIGDKFVYLRYTYKDLGLSALEWLRPNIRNLTYNIPSIKRELLLEWF